MKNHGLYIMRANYRICCSCCCYYYYHLLFNIYTHSGKLLESMGTGSLQFQFQFCLLLFLFLLSSSYITQTIHENINRDPDNKMKHLKVYNHKIDANYFHFVHFCLSFSFGCSRLSLSLSRPFI